LIGVPCVLSVTLLLSFSNWLILEGLKLSFVTVISPVLSALEVDLIAIDGCLPDADDCYLVLYFLLGLEFKYNVLAMSSA
jgi:hypothetical protein